MASGKWDREQRTSWDCPRRTANRPGSQRLARRKRTEFLQSASAGRHAADGDRPRSEAFSRCARRQGGFKMGARTALSARSWLHTKFARTRLSALLSRRLLNPRCGDRIFATVCADGGWVPAKPFPASQRRRRARSARVGDRPDRQRSLRIHFPIDPAK